MGRVDRKVGGPKELLRECYAKATGCAWSY
jgi:hypothetical protein